MPRNKYPEVTEKAILDTAKRLFLEHGYEHVTLQDIAEACGLTRGAIYHHFHGKEEMLDAVTTYMFHETVPCREIQEDTSRNGLEKLQRLIIASVSNREPGLRCFLCHGRCAVRGGTDLASIRCPLGHLILQIYIQSERMYKEVSL